MADNETYGVDIAGVHRELRLFEVKPGLKIAIINILGDTELVEACAKELCSKLQRTEFDVLVTAEAKSIPLAHALSVASGKPYVILRKSYKPYMGDALKAETLSITTGKPQTLFLDEIEWSGENRAKFYVEIDGNKNGECRTYYTEYNGKTKFYGIELEAGTTVEMFVDNFENIVADFSCRIIGGLR